MNDMPPPLSGDLMVPLDKVRAALKVAHNAGWVARDLRADPVSRWTEYTDPHYVELIGVDTMMEEDYAEFMDQVRLAGEAAMHNQADGTAGVPGTGG